MTIEELEAEGNKIVTEFEKGFEDLVRPFYKSIKAYTDQVMASSASDRTKQALMLSVLDGLNEIGNIADRVGAEEGIS